MIVFYKKTHFSEKKGEWINAAAEHNYVSMSAFDYRLHLELFLLVQIA